MVTETGNMTCEGCGERFYNFFDRLAICLTCVKARHRAALALKCLCGRQARQSDVHRVGSRTWISCLRCLGSIRQLS